MALLRQVGDADPWQVVFALEFEDTNGDLADGTANFYVGGNEQASQIALLGIFRQAGLPESATQGRLGIPLRFSETVPDGARVTLGTQLVDADAARSNCYANDIHFDVDPVD